LFFLFDIGFIPVSIWDVLDVGIVGYLMYRIYLLLRGSIAFNIFVGVVILYVIWWLVGLLKMEMLSLILSQFVNVGFIIIIIIFQPEVRRFLLLLGNTTLRGRSTLIGKWLESNLDLSLTNQADLKEIQAAILKMSREKTGALIVFTKDFDAENIGHSGEVVNAQISQSLLLSIFQKESPLHDGAVLIGKGKILAASCILPVSESDELPESAGLRHRAALGVTERTTIAAVVVSEESGTISFAYDGRLEAGISEGRLSELLNLHFS
jgi:uncharacterized protein (TIGR00159 family)